MLLLLKGPDPTPCKPQALKSSVEWERIQQTHEIQLLGPAALQAKPTLKPPSSFTSPPNQIQSGPPVTTHPGVVNQGHYEQDMTAAMGTMVRVVIVRWVLCSAVLSTFFQLILILFCAILQFSILLGYCTFSSAGYACAHTSIWGILRFMFKDISSFLSVHLVCQNTFLIHASHWIPITSRRLICVEVLILK